MQRRNLVTAFCITTIVTAAVAFGSEELPEVQYPVGYRSWRHVKSIVIGPEHKSFSMRGGIHHYYANDLAMEGYRTGNFPNGAVIVDEGVLTKEGEGEAKGILLEGERRGIDVMVKDDRLYKATGGWGFEHFNRDNKTGVLLSTGRNACHTCHSKQKDRDYVFSSPRQ